MSNKKPEGPLEAVSHAATDVDIHSHYKEWADDYDHDLVSTYGYIGHRLVAEALAAALRQSGAEPGEVEILDAGCGTGLVVPELVTLGFSVVDGLDFSAAMLDKARALGLYRRLYEADLTTRTELADQAYDGVAAAGVFAAGHLSAHHVGELIRVAKVGAPIVIGVNEVPYLHEKYDDHFAQLEADGVWRIAINARLNYMDELERPGRIITAYRV